MQIVESTSFGVRSVAFTLEAADGRPRFLLFPMIHVAKAQFYDEVRKRLESCDLILFEGVPGIETLIVTLSYRLLTGSRRLGLVSQRTALPFKSFGSRAVRADISNKSFKTGWRRMGFPLRLFLLTVAPVYGFYLRFFGTRERLAARLGVDSLASREDILIDDFAEPFMDLILHVRDRVLEGHLGTSTSSNAATIGVVYGAKHMPAVIRFLTDRAGYRIVAREFLTVMSL